MMAEFSEMPHWGAVKFGASKDIPSRAISLLFLS